MSTTRTDNPHIPLVRRRHNISALRRLVGYGIVR
jgi:hypothetical protein